MANTQDSEFNSSPEEIQRRLLEATADSEKEPRLYRHSEYQWDRSQEKYWDTVTNQLVGAIAVDASVPTGAWTQPAPRGGQGRPPGPIPPSKEIRDVERNQTVHTSTWWPGMPQIIENTMSDATGFYNVDGVKVFNAYRPPQLGVSNGDATPWIAHVKALWPREEEHEYFFNYAAHMVQFPGIKCNAAVILSGTQGIGKDAALLPLKVAVGLYNCANISPDTLFEKFNEYVKSVMLIVDEARSESGDHKATTMYNVIKQLCVAPPDSLRMNLKKMQPIWVRNCLRLFITTNEVDGLFVPRDDRRLFILHSEITRAETKGWMEKYWKWLNNGGGEAVAAWLAARDVSNFDPAQEPPKTTKHQELAAAWGHDPTSAIGMAFNSMVDENGELPPVITAAELRKAVDKIAFDDKDNRVKGELAPRSIGRTMERAGYVQFNNRDTADGAWDIAKAVGGKTYKVRIKMAYRRYDFELKLTPPIIDRKLTDLLAETIRNSEMRAVHGGKTIL